MVGDSLQAKSLLAKQLSKLSKQYINQSKNGYYRVWACTNGIVVKHPRY
jgi:hypothetical protein